MIKFFKYFFTYVPPEPLPEVEKDEQPDANHNCSLTDSVRAARRMLMMVCGLCIAWSTAQFAISNYNVEIANVSINLKDASVPIVLAVLLIYLTIRWIIEFAMMERHIRQWKLAQIDFKLVLTIVRFTLLSLAAGALDRSLWTVLIVIFSIVLLAFCSIILSIPLLFVTMNVRINARKKASRNSVASAAGEAVYWTELFSISLTAMSVVGLGIASYYFSPLRNLIWDAPPNPLALSIFVLTLIGVFLSYWLMLPLTNRIFSVKPNYYTERDSDGSIIYHFYK